MLSKKGYTKGLEPVQGGPQQKQYSYLTTKTRTNQLKKITINNGKHIQKKHKHKTILFRETRWLLIRP